MLGFRQLSSKYTHMTLKLLINSFNVFGLSPRLTITKAKQFNTLIGFCSTLGFAILVILLIQFDLREILFRYQPIVINSEQQLDSLTEYPLQQQNFTLAVSLFDINLQYFENANDNFQVSFKFCRKGSNQFQQQQSYNCTEQKAVTCSESHFQENYQKQYFQNQNISKLFCLNLTAFTQPQALLQGMFTSDSYSDITIQLKQFGLCPSQSEQRQCKGWSPFYYVIHFTDTLFQWDNSKNLSQQIVRSQYHSIAENQTKRILQSFKVIEKKVDDTYVYRSEEKSSNLKLQDYKESVALSIDGFLIQHQINLHPEIMRYHISYPKMSVFLGKLAGCILFVHFLLYIVFLPLNQLLYQIDLTNRIFRLSGPVNDLKVKECDLQYQQNEQIMKQSAYFQNVDSPNSYCWANVNENLIQQNPRIVNYLHNVKKSLLVSWSELILLLFSCGSRHKKQIKYAQAKLNKKMDIVFLIQKIFEIDRLKYILLDSDQLNLFNSMQKNFVSLEDKAKRDGQYCSEEDTKIEKLQKGFKSYVNLQVKQQKCATDLKLLSLLDNETISLFELLYQDLTFKSFFKNISLKESKTFKIKKEKSQDEFLNPQNLAQRHIKLQTNADQ